MPVVARLVALLAARAAVAVLGLQLELPRQMAREAAGAQPTPPRGLQKFRQRLVNEGGMGMQYTAAVSVGGQAIQGVLDTGSYELLVFSTECSTCGSTDGYYNSSRSSTHEPGHMKVTHSFGSGTTSSQLGYDNVAVGPMQASRQYFWQVVGADMPVAASGSFQAIVGVGPPSTPRSDSLEQAEQAQKMKKEAQADPTYHASEQVKAAFRDAVSLAEEQTLLENFGVTAFSVCIGRAEGSEGYFIWNDADPQTRRAGLFTKVPVAGEMTWGVQLSNVQMQSSGGGASDVQLGCEGGCGALLDSGTSLLVVPREAAQRALQALNGLNSDCSNLDALPRLVFQLGSEKFSLPPQAYLGQFVGELPHSIERFARRTEERTYRACELLIMTMDIDTQLGPMWILGLPFFREYYSTFSLGADVMDRTTRSIYFAEAGDDCQPQMPAGPHALVQRSLRQVDLSKVRVPHWVASVADEGSVLM